MRVLPMGPVAILVEDPPGGPAAWTRGLRRLAPNGVVDVVPGASTVLIRCVDTESKQRIVESVSTVVPVAQQGEGDAITIEVRYDGEDLAEVARLAGISIDEVVELHTGVILEVAFCGFAPGFAYLTGLPEPLHVPRRPTPRTRVPSGSVAIAAGYTAV